MAWTTPRTWVATEVVTAAIMNTHVRDNLDYLKASPALTSPTFAGDIGLAATKKLYLDGVAMTGDTYIVESAGNTLSLYSGGVEAKLTSGVLTVSGFGAHTFSAGGTGANVLNVVNTTDGTGNYAQINAQAGTTIGSLYSLAQGFSTSGKDVAAATVLHNNFAGGLSIAATHASGAIRFYSGGTTPRWQMDSAGTLLSANMNIGSTTAGEQVNAIFLKSSTPIYTPNMASTTGTALVLSAGGYIELNSSSARFKNVGEPIVLTPDLRTAFLALSPKAWDYKGQQNGAFGFIAEDLAALPILNAYGTNPLINYNKDGLPESNRDFALIGLQHLVLQQHDAELSALRARVAEVEAKIALLSHN